LSGWRRFDPTVKSSNSGAARHRHRARGRRAGAPPPPAPLCQGRRTPRARGRGSRPPPRRPRAACGSSRASAAAGAPSRGGTAQVDANTGYRYYALDQLQQADTIASLRALDVSLDECSAILAENESQDVRARLVAHRARVADKARQLQQMVARLDDLIDGKAE